MIPLALFAVAFLVRAVVGALFWGPAYPDSYYYVNVAEQLAAGNGLTVDYIWNFVEVGGRLPAEAVLPIPANAHWMPLAALVQVPFMWLLGPSALAAGLPFWLAGAAAAPLTYLIGRDAGIARLPSAAAGMLVAVPGALTPFLSQPDNFGLFVSLGALSLWLCARGMRGDRRAFVLGGAVVGLATLARSDGVLLGLPYALFGLHQVWRGVDRRHAVGRRHALAAAIGCAALFALVTLPWFARQLDVFGSLAPSASSGRILWLTDYAQLYSVGDAPSMDTFLAQGIGPLLASRVGGLLAALGLFALLPLVAVLAPLAVIGMWARRRDRAFRPAFVYAAALFGASGLLFAVHVPHGTFIHSAVALLPHTFLLVVVGVGEAVGWVARRRSSWDAARAVPVFVSGAVVVALAGAALQTLSTTRHWAEVRGVQDELAIHLRAAPPTDRVASADAGAYRYLAERGGIVTPNDPLPVIEAAMRAYEVRWLALEREQIVPALAPVLAGELRPSWLSAPVATVADRGALYAVCFAAQDERCAQ